MRRTNPDSLRSCLCFQVFRLNFLLDFFILLLGIIVKHLIQGRNNETRLGVEPLTLRSQPSYKRRSEPLRHAVDDYDAETRSRNRGPKTYSTWPCGQISWKPCSSRTPFMNWGFTAKTWNIKTVDFSEQCVKQRNSDWPLVNQKKSSLTSCVAIKSCWSL